VLDVRTVTPCPTILQWSCPGPSRHSWTYWPSTDGAGRVSLAGLGGQARPGPSACALFLALLASVACGLRVGGPRRTRPQRCQRGRRGGWANDPCCLGKACQVAADDVPAGHTGSSAAFSRSGADFSPREVANQPWTHGVRKRTRHPCRQGPKHVHRQPTPAGIGVQAQPRQRLSGGGRPRTVMRTRIGRGWACKPPSIPLRIERCTLRKQQCQLQMLMQVISRTQSNCPQCGSHIAKQKVLLEAAYKVGEELKAHGLHEGVRCTWTPQRPHDYGYVHGRPRRNSATQSLPGNAGRATRTRQR